MGKPDDDKWRTRYGGWIISLSSHECVVDIEPEVTLSLFHFLSCHRVH